MDGPEHDVGRAEKMEDVGVPDLGMAIRLDLPRGTERILFVDDDEILTRLGRVVLGQLGYQVEEFTSPEEALNRFRQDPGTWDLLITDQTMPGMTGARLIEEIRSLRADFPAILSTGSSRDEEVALRLGLGALLSKPFSVPELAAAVRGALDRQGASIRRVDLTKAAPADPGSGQGGGSALPAPIAGLDMRDGLSRMLGDRDLYRNLLDRFLASQGTAPGAIRSACEANDLATAGDLAHTLKGVSSTLGATVVSALAARLEEFFRTGGDPDEGPDRSRLPRSGHGGPGGRAESGSGGAGNLERLAEPERTGSSKRRREPADHPGGGRHAGIPGAAQPPAEGRIPGSGGQ